MLSVISCLLFAGLVSSDAFDVSLELMGNCSPNFTLVCRHSNNNVEPLWKVNDRRPLGPRTSFPESMYTLSTMTQHTLPVTHNTIRYNGDIIQCVYNFE